MRDGVCFEIPQCDRRKEFLNTETYECECRATYVRRNGECERIPFCKIDETLDRENNVCVCKEGLTRVG